MRSDYELANEREREREMSEKIKNNNKFSNCEKTIIKKLLLTLAMTFKSFSFKWKSCSKILAFSARALMIWSSFIFICAANGRKSCQPSTTMNSLHILCIIIGDGCFNVRISLRKFHT